MSNIEISYLLRTAFRLAWNKAIFNIIGTALKEAKKEATKKATKEAELCVLMNNACVEFESKCSLYDALDARRFLDIAKEIYTKAKAASMNELAVCASDSRYRIKVCFLNALIYEEDFPTISKKDFVEKYPAIFSKKYPSVMAMFDKINSGIAPSCNAQTPKAIPA